MGIKIEKRKEIKKDTRKNASGGATVTRTKTINKNNGSKKVKERSTSYNDYGYYLGGNRTGDVKATGKKTRTTVTKRSYCK